MPGGVGFNRALASQNPTQDQVEGKPQQQVRPQNNGAASIEKPRSGGYDGPGEPSQRGPNPFGRGMGFDPAKPAPLKEKVISNSRVELPASAYTLEGPSVCYFFSSAICLYTAISVREIVSQNLKGSFSINQH